MVVVPMDFISEKKTKGISGHKDLHTYTAEYLHIRMNRGHLGV